MARAAEIHLDDFSISHPLAMLSPLFRNVVFMLSLGTHFSVLQICLQLQVVRFVLTGCHQLTELLVELVSVLDADLKHHSYKMATSELSCLTCDMKLKQGVSGSALIFTHCSSSIK